eukprot:scaffold69686_cov59-Phaeocystis_antarctica.AAC.4
MAKRYMVEPILSRAPPEERLFHIICLASFPPSRPVIKGLYPADRLSPGAAWFACCSLVQSKEGGTADVRR